ncbi:hypothetical protein POTOM_038247 [Populus tomentosa]|uniref:Uncharacterized protein n=1 Tax=Populus tomentosa TaxID=118781 RepID=A0A8X7YS20_POPTO|nr:hypothetical protein POTOM_038247 [Populus tomentosa]
MDAAFGRPLSPTFDPYASSLHYPIVSNVIPYVELTGYVGANPKLQAVASKKLVAGLLAVESGQEAVIRGRLYEYALASRVQRIKFGGNVLAGDEYSVEYTRTPEEILGVVYCCGNESITGGFYPKGADGRIAKSHLQHC